MDYLHFAHSSSPVPNPFFSLSPQKHYVMKKLLELRFLHLKIPQ